MNEHEPTRPWYQHAVIYQIYPLSFKDNNGDGKGDLEGIISKLDYLEWLGVDAVWFSPIYPSPMKDHGYDISNYCDIDATFGSLQIFAKLIDEAHKRKIKVVMDMVTNHTSSEHPWFIESRSSKDNPKRDWYVWHDPGQDGGLPNNWLAVSGGPSWTFDEKSGQYYLHQFLPDQPDLNWRNPDVKNAMKQVMEFWIDKGVDGFRVDAISHMIEDSEFRNEPAAIIKAGAVGMYDSLSHIYSKDQPELKEVIRLFSEIAHTHKNTFIVSETYLPIEGLVEFYRACPYHNHAPFNFNLIALPWQAQAYRASIDVYDKVLNPNDVRPYVLGNHDLPRLASRLGTPQARIAAMLLLTLHGTQFIYYGEELGMTNAVIPENKRQDHFTHDEKVGSRDQARTPMQWDASLNSGFSPTEPWLPVADTFTQVNVESEKKDPHSMLSLYKSLIELKKKEPTLLKGSYISLDTTSHHVFAYERSYGEETILVYLNFLDDMRKVELPVGEFEVVLSTIATTEVGKKIQGELTLASLEGVVLRRK